MNPRGRMCGSPWPRPRPHRQRLPEPERAARFLHEVLAAENPEVCTPDDADAHPVEGAASPGAGYRAVSGIEKCKMYSGDCGQ